MLTLMSLSLVITMKYSPACSESGIVNCGHVGKLISSSDLVELLTEFTTIAKWQTEYGTVQCKLLSKINCACLWNQSELASCIVNMQNGYIMFCAIS